MSQTLKYIKRLLPEQVVEGIRHSRTPLWRRENALDDEATRAIIRAFLIGGSGIFVDVGAHDGAILSAAVESAPDRLHHAFEPGPVAEVLRLRFPSVVVHNCCVGAADGEVDFFIYERSTRSSLHAVPGEQLVASVRTPQVTIDQVFDRSAPVSVIKIDVEGSELEVLRGAARLLSTQAPVVIFEHGSPTGTKLESTEPLFELLKSNGYQLAPVRGGVIDSHAKFAELVRTGTAWNFLAVTKSVSEIRSQGH